MTIASRADIARLEADAERIATPCDGGALTWHAWGAGRPVVLLHGGSGSWTHWCRNVEALVAGGRRVIVPDLPGFGDSAAIPGVTDADDVPAVLEPAIAALVGDAPFDLVGFSFGSLVATLIAARGRLPLQRLVVVGPYLRGDEPGPPLRLRPWADTPPGPDRDAIHRHNLAVLMLARPASIDALAIALHGANLERDRMRSRRVAMTNLMRDTLPRVGCPLTAIWGSEDFGYRGREAVVRRVIGLAPTLGPVHEISGAGHWVQYEDAGAFDALLAATLDH